MFGAAAPVWDATKCTLELKLAQTRIKNYKRKKTEQNEAIKREVAALMTEDKNEQARVRAMALINEDYMFEVLLMAELYCARILLRMEVISAQISCPLDITEQVYGLVYIAPYLEKVTELLKIRDLFVAKYGTNMLIEGVEGKCVAPKVIDLLSRATPSECLIDFYMGTIALNQEIPWEPSGRTDVTSDLFDPLLVDEPIDETALPIERFPQPEENSMNFPDSSTTELLLPPFPDAPFLSDSYLSNLPITAEGILRMDRAGNYWVIEQQDPNNPIFIPTHEIGFSKSGDHVVVTLDSRSDGKRSGAISHCVLHQAHDLPDSSLESNLLTAELKRDKNGNMWAVNRLSNGADQYIFIPEQQTNGGEDGDRAKVSLDARDDGKLSGFVVSIDKK